jgi:hypothetical protein
MQSGTYADLLIRIRALAGVDAFTTNEDTLINSFINRRGYQAYRESDTWARFIVAAEARPGPLNIIPFSYTAADGNRSISSATRSGTTVTVTTSTDIDGDLVSGQYVTIASLSYSTANPNGVQQITVSDDAVFTFELSDDTLTGTETYSGSGTVVPVALNDVDSFIRVFNGFPYNLTGAGEYTLYVQSDGCHVIGNSTEAAGFWVCYKKQWDGPYDGTTNTDVPLEFFNYIAHAAYADFLRMDGQLDKALAEEQVAKEYLFIELTKPQNQANGQLTSRFQSHGTRQSRS